MEINFDYTLIRRPSRRSLTITVTPENQVRILAPAFLSENRIRNFLSSKSSWVLKQIEENVRRPKPVLRRFEPGEIFPFAGKGLLLEIQESRRGKIEFFPGKLLVSVPEKMAGEERRSYIAWRIEDGYRAEAVKVFRERVLFFQEKAGLQAAGRIRVKQYQSQWGSASRDKNLSFNWRLVLAPLEILDYVVVHELVHLEHLNHSPRFWARVGEVLPDYRERRHWLRTRGGTLWLKYAAEARNDIQ